jgi:hypothetical protein
MARRESLHHGSMKSGLELQRHWPIKRLDHKDSDQFFFWIHPELGPEYTDPAKAVL